MPFNEIKQGNGLSGLNDFLKIITGGFLSNDHLYING